MLVIRTFYIEKPHAKIEFKVIFQEIWDFVLSFEDWAASNVNSLFSEPINAGISFKLVGDITTVENMDFKKGTFPEWSTFSGEIQFRGTSNDLETQTLEISLENCAELNLGFKKKPITNTELKGVTVDGLISSFMIAEDTKHHSADTLETQIRGKICTNMLPQYKQIGSDSVIIENEIYVIIRLGKITNFNSPNFVKLPVTIYITVEWVIIYNRKPLFII